MDTRNDQPIPAGETAETTPSRRQTLALMLGAASRPALLAPERAAGIGVHDAPAMPLGCGLRRSEAAARTMGYVERRYGRWCVVEGARAPARRVTCGLPPRGGRGDGQRAAGAGVGPRDRAARSASRAPGPRAARVRGPRRSQIGRA